MLPKAKRRAIKDVYAFCRLLDDIVDEDQSGRNAHHELAYWRKEVESWYQGYTTTPMGEQLLPSIEEFDLPKQPFLDLIEGMAEVMLYFALAALVAIAIIFFYTRCVRSTAVVIACSAAAVAWQLGLVAAFGYELDPYSILVPFLVFAIGVSHGAQKMNGIMQDIGRGMPRLAAARTTFRRLFLAGLTALVADAVGFAVLMAIDIPIIKDLALAASMGVAVLIFTNLVLLPVLLSYIGVGEAAAARTLRTVGDDARTAWSWLDRLVERRWELGLLGGAALLPVAGLAVGTRLQIGDLDPGAPELRADSRYNRDNAYITAHYSL